MIPSTSDLAAYLASPAELGWGYTVDLGHDFLGRDALAEEADAGGPRRVLRGLRWNPDDIGQLFADQFRDTGAPAPPDLPWGQFRLSFPPVTADGQAAGFACAAAYSPTLRAMISHARLDRELAEGTEVQVSYQPSAASPARTIRAVVADPWFLPDRRRQPLSASAVS